jgi:pyrroloquinoline quinone biosynthesis protein D
MPTSTAIFRRAPSSPRSVEETRSKPYGSAPPNISVTEASRPILPRHAKLRFDETRQRWVILAPERVLAPDEIAVEVLQLCDGDRRVDQMVDLLAAKYVAERAAITSNVIAMLQNLADKGFLTETREASV